MSDSQTSATYLSNFLKKRRSLNEIEDSESANKRNKVESASPVRNDTENKFQSPNSSTGSVNESLIEKIVIRTVERGPSHLHEVALPPGLSMPVLKPIDNLVVNYPFTLDEYQRRAVTCIHNGYSVLVSAHTSAGKTAVAEYAIACALRDRQRVIYTTPIKALSNQKYREFLADGKYVDVGLMTGDIIINPSASLLIMTTEILRLMIYRGSDLIREIGWAVFDEVHYMRDISRGVVWEECISLLPRGVRFVFLSATVPNAGDFARWIVSLQLSGHNESSSTSEYTPMPCHVIYTESRPVPLEHCLTIAGSKEIHKVLSEDGSFNEDELATVMRKVLSLGDSALSDTDRMGRQGGNQRQTTAISRVIQSVIEQQMGPIIVFSFNKRHAELFAKSLMENKLNLVNDAEKKHIDEICENALSTMSEQDRNLVQIRNICQWMSCGIAVHHGGLLPLVKELVEIVFSEGLIKVLFATETFAMGLNMPARTVIFSSLSKFDGNSMRCLSSSEYTQMSGRAGRRGRDDRGTVILLVTSDLKESDVRNVLTGPIEALHSSFRLTYNMILNLMRFGANSSSHQAVEVLMRRSFFQFQSIDRMPRLMKEINEIQTELCNSQLSASDCENAKQYHDLLKAQSSIERDLWKLVFSCFNASPLLCCGRIVKIMNHDWCIIVDPSCRYVKGQGTTAVLCCLTTNHSLMSPWQLKTFKEDEIIGISKAKMMLEERTRTRLEQSMELRQSIQKPWSDLCAQHNDMTPFHPVNDLKLQQKDAQELCDKLDIIQKRIHQVLKTSAATQHDLPHILNAWEHFESLQSRLATMRHESDVCQSLLQLDDLRTRRSLLLRLGFCDAASDSQVTLKGRVACEINSCDELLLTELLFDNFFNTLTVPECAAALSVLVFDERLLPLKEWQKKNKTIKRKDKKQKPTRASKSKEEDILGELPIDIANDEAYQLVVERLTSLYSIMKKKTLKLVEMSRQCRIVMDETDYIAKTLRPGLMLMVYEWARERSFSHVLHLNTRIFPGSIIRSLRRLAEVTQQMQTAAQVMNSQELEVLFLETSKAVKRGIVYAGSLYI